MRPDLTPAELDMLRSLPRRLAAMPRGAIKTEQAETERRRRLQNQGLLTVKAEPDSGVFLVMITEKGVDALQAGAPAR